MNGQRSEGSISEGDFKEWIGRSTSTDDEIALSAVRRMAAMFDVEPDTFSRNDAIPPHWYSMFFTPNARQSRLGHDGHPAKGDFLPPIPLPRRMFVGRSVEFHTPLRVGDVATKHSEISSITPKSGRSGPLVFLQVSHTIKANDKVVLIERQEVVYREAATPGAAPAAKEAAKVSKPDWSHPYPIDPVLVFRYSAASWNGHRIHYDADYARKQEGYPACVMNGALTVHLLVDQALARAKGKRLARLTARLSKPLFVGQTMILAGSSLQDGGAMEAWATDEQGGLAANVSLHFE
jgi:3-methylfumaryl-CoA hydratase